MSQKKYLFSRFLFSLLTCASAFGADTGTSSGLQIETGLERFTGFVTNLAKYLGILGVAAVGVWWMFGQMGRGFMYLVGTVIGCGIIYAGSNFFDFLGINPALY